MVRTRIDLLTGDTASGVLVCQLQFTLTMRKATSATFQTRWMPPSELRAAGIDLSQGSDILRLDLGGLGSAASCDEHGYTFKTDNGALCIHSPTADVEDALGAVLAALGQISDKAIIIPRPAARQN
jgi:hypothetical protein